MEEKLEQMRPRIENYSKLESQLEDLKTQFKSQMNSSRDKQLQEMEVRLRVKENLIDNLKRQHHKELEEKNQEYQQLRQLYDKTTSDLAEQVEACRQRDEDKKLLLERSRQKKEEFLRAREQQIKEYEDTIQNLKLRIQQVEKDHQEDIEVFKKQKQQIQASLDNERVDAITKKYEKAKQILQQNELRFKELELKIESVSQDRNRITVKFERYQKKISRNLTTYPD